MKKIIILLILIFYLALPIIATADADGDNKYNIINWKVNQKEQEWYIYNAKSKDISDNYIKLNVLPKQKIEDSLTIVNKQNKNLNLKIICDSLYCEDVKYTQTEITVLPNSSSVLYYEIDTTNLKYFDVAQILTNFKDNTGKIKGFSTMLNITPLAFFDNIMGQSVMFYIIALVVAIIFSFISLLFFRYILGIKKNVRIISSLVFLIALILILYFNQYLTFLTQLI